MFKWTIRLSIATPILVIVTVLLAGGGHGFLKPILCTYPIAFVFEFKNENNALIPMLFQFPLYGLLIDLAKIFFNKRYYGIILAVGLHVTILLIALSKTKNWD